MPGGRADMWLVSKGAAVPSPPVADPGERQRRFEAVYAAHRGPILGYVLRRTSSPDDAADVIAETFLTAWRRLDISLKTHPGLALARRHRGVHRRVRGPPRHPDDHRAGPVLHRRWR
jgi:Sigma-70 region 2